MTNATAWSFDPAWLSTATEGTWVGAPTRPITGICHDTRTLLPGDLYVAIRGSRLDGHALLAEAAQAGAVAALVDAAYVETADPVAGLPLLVVPATVPALGQLASVHRHRTGAWITGITGSMGKTTVKDMVTALLGQIGTTVSTKGNWNNDIGLPLSLLSLQPDTLHGVFEVGMNHPGELAPLSRMLSPDWGIVTSIGPVHLAHFTSVDAIAAEKAELLRALPPSGLALLPRDDPYFALLAEAAPCAVRTFSLEADADLVVRPGPGILQVEERGRTTPVTLAWTWPGRHNAWNAGLALLTARAAGLGWDAIQAGLDAYVPPPMRWEEHAVAGVTIINDAYNANPPSMKAALDTFATIDNQGRKWLVLGDMLELGQAANEAHQQLGQWAASADVAGMVVLGDYRKPVVTAARAEAGRDMSIAAVLDVQEAWAWLRARIAPGDMILLKGSRGMRLEQLLDYMTPEGKEEE